MHAAQNFVGVLKCVHVQSARRYQNINGHEKNRPNNNVSNQKESKRPIPFTVDIITLIFFLGRMSKTIFSSHFPLDIGVRESTNLFINNEVLEMYITTVYYFLYYYHIISWKK